MQTVEIMERTFESESSEIALYLAMSRKAEEEGHEDIALYLRKVAMDEAMHAAEFAMLLGMIKDTKANLTMMLEREIITEKDKEEAAEIAKAEGDEDAMIIFERSGRDESSHKEGIRKILLKLHGKD